MKKYPKILFFRISPEHLEWTIGMLISEGIHTWEEKKSRKDLELYTEIPKGRHSKNLIKNIVSKERFLGQKIFKKAEIKEIRDQSWQKKYLATLRPFEIPQASSSKSLQDPICIDPTFQPKPGPMRIALSAGMAFGTGTHPSTQLALRALQDALLENPKQKVLDIGTGSGILAMVANLRGGKEIHAVENDPEALAVAKDNFKLNQMKHIKTYEDVSTLRGKYTLILANILAPVLIQLFPKIKRLTSRGGQVVLSGLTYREVPDLLKAYRGYQILKRYNHKGWSALRLIKSEA